MPWSSPVTRTTGYKVTATNWNQLVNNQLWVERVSYVEFTSSVTVTSTNSASPNDVVSSGSLTYEDGFHLILFSCPSTNLDTSQTTFLQMWDSSTSLGRIARHSAVTGAVSRNIVIPFFHTVTAGTHEFKVRAYLGGAGTTTLNVGTGGSGNDVPGFIAVFRIPVAT